MKCAIITIYDPDPNYGNRLQNYAVQRVLDNMNIKGETVVFEPSILTKEVVFKYTLQRLTMFRLPGDVNYWKCFIPKVINFEKFNRDYIRKICVKNIQDIVDKNFDIYVLGSDQVWNPEWYSLNQYKKDIFLLTFAKPEQKVCFSPSFAVDTLSKEWVPWFVQHLSKFPRISIREESGAKLIKELVGKDAEVLIDPTLMLDSEEWKKIARKPKKIDTDRPYILTYFIGGISERVKNDLDKISKTYNFNIYNLMEYSQPDLFVSGPCEFLHLIMKSSVVLTDSFHACVFSFLFERPFLVYNRVDVSNSMMSRINTLLNKFHLERKYVDSHLVNDLLENNYEDGFQVLKEERSKVISFLFESLNQNEERMRKE